MPATTSAAMKHQAMLRIRSRLSSGVSGAGGGVIFHKAMMSLIMGFP
jgi:hypothetical protein